MKKEQEHRTAASDGWVLSYADLMSLLTCFFLLLYNTGESDPERQMEIQKQLMATFAPKKLQEEIKMDDITDIHRAFYVLMSLINMEGHTDKIVENLSEQYEKKQKKDAIRASLQESLKGKLKDLENKIAKEQADDEVVIEFVLSPGKKRVQGNLLPAEKRQVRNLGEILKKYKSLADIEVVYFLKGNELFNYELVQTRMKNKSAHQVAKILAGAGVGLNRIKIVSAPNLGIRLPVGRNNRQRLAEQRINIKVTVKQSG